jgi:hypothetical protein
MIPSFAPAEGRSMSAALRIARLRRLHGLSPELAAAIASLAWGGRSE